MSQSTVPILTAVGIIRADIMSSFSIGATTKAISSVKLKITAPANRPGLAVIPEYSTVALAKDIDGVANL